MFFWIRNIVFGIILAVLAYLFFINKALLLSFTDDASSAPSEVSQDSASPETIKTNTPVDTKNNKDSSKNSAAAGLSKLYATINGSTDVDKPTIRKNIVYLPPLKGDLELLLNERQKVVRAYPKDWQGSKAPRPFRLGETIYEKMSEYAKKERIEVFWRLRRDFIVKDGFRINKTIIKTALQLGLGISGHFQNEVSVYFCYQEKSLVFIEGTKSYLDERCALLKPNVAY